MKIFDNEVFLGSELEESRIELDFNFSRNPPKGIDPENFSTM